MNNENQKISRITKQTLIPTGSFTKKQYGELNGLADPAAYASIQKRVLLGMVKETGFMKTGKKGKPAVLFAAV